MTGRKDAPGDTAASTSAATASSAPAPAPASATRPGPERTRFVPDRRSFFTRIRGSLARAVGVGLVLFLLYAFAPLGKRVTGDVALELAGTLVMIMIVAVLEVRAIGGSTDPEVRAVEAVAVLIPLVLLPFSAAYFITSAHEPTSFSHSLTRIDAFYFTITTFSTVGYGDIVPVTQAARVMVSVQIVVDLMLIGLIARVVFGAAQRRRRDLAEHDRS